MNNKWWFGGAMIIVLLVLFVLIRIPVIELATNDEKYFIRDNPFVLSWIHSVEKEPWHEVYERKEDKLILKETYVKTYGAGVPFNSEVIGKKDGFTQLKVDREMDKVNVVVSDNVETTITIGSKDIALYKIVEPYSEVTLEVKELYLWNLLEGEFL